MTSIYEPIKAQSRITDSVIVSFSGGKDSCVTLDLCYRYFKNVKAFFMYQVPNLSFQEASIRFAEEKYGIEIMRIPHFELSYFMRYGVFCKGDAGVRIVNPIEAYSFVRLQTDAWWIAAGERITDSIVRRAMIKKSGSVDEKRGRFYPIAQFTKKDIDAYVAHHRLKVSPESKLLGHSFRSLSPEDLNAVKKHYPKDFERILEFFPLAEASAYRHEMTS